MYRHSRQTLQGQGTARYTPEEIAAFRLEIWESLNGLLTDVRSSTRGTARSKKPFWVLGEDGPTEADATLFSFIVSVLICTA